MGDDPLPDLRRQRRTGDVLLNLLALAASTLLGLGVVAALTILASVCRLSLKPPPDHFGTPAERYERRLATYRSAR